MKIQNLNLVYFSPTHTTQQLLFAMAEGMPGIPVDNLDLTLPTVTDKLPHASSGDLTLFGSPVYAGRIPPDVANRLGHFKGNGSPAIIMVTYGNREFEDALLELKHLVEKNGYIVAAAGAFIGEHSYSTAEKPIAPGRPDHSDLEKARKFGRDIYEKLSHIETLTEKVVPHVPGNFPYKEIKSMPGIKPVTDPDLCSQCFECAPVCPTKAIHPSDPHQTNESLCIRCCACIKVCPSGARSMKDPRITKIKDFLFTNYSVRKEPEIFI